MSVMNSIKMDSNINILNLYEHALYNHYHDYAIMYKDILRRNLIRIPKHIETRESIAEFYQLLQQKSLACNIKDELNRDASVVDAFEILVSNI